MYGRLYTKEGPELNTTVNEPCRPPILTKRVVLFQTETTKYWTIRHYYSEWDMVTIPSTGEVSSV